MARRKIKPLPPLTSTAKQSTTIGLTPLEYVAARVLASRRGVSVSRLVSDGLRANMTERFGTDWEPRIAEIAAQEGLAA